MTASTTSNALARALYELEVLLVERTPDLGEQLDERVVTELE